VPVWVSFYWGVNRPGFEVTTHINLVPSSRVCGAIPLLLQMPSGRVPLPLPYEYLFIYYECKIWDYYCVYSED
jgi:hypothetical protein